MLRLYTDRMLTWLDDLNCWRASVTWQNQDGLEIIADTHKLYYGDAIDYLRAYPSNYPILVYTNARNTPDVTSWTVPYSENCRKVK